MEGAVPLRLQGSLLGLEVGLDGTLGTRDDAMTLDASLTAKGPSLAGLARWIGPWSDRSGPVAARLRVKGGGISYRLSAVELSLGQRRLEGGVRLELTTPRPRVEVALELDQLDARGWLTGVPMAGRGGAQSGRPASLDGSLDLGWMDAADISARLRIRQLTTPLVAGATATVDIELGGRVLRLSADDIGVGDAPVTARFRLDGKTRPPQAQLRFDGRRLALAPMLAGTAAEGMIQGDVDLVLDLEAKGASIAGMLEALSGELLLLAQDGRADLSALDRMTPGVQDLWGLLATPQSRLARINCALGVLQFERGRADIAALIDSANSTVVGHGSLDLDVGTIDLRLDPSPKGVHLRVAAPVVIDGELAHPDIRVRKGELLVSLTGLASKIAVPHLLLVEAFGAAVSGNPCVALASGVPDSGPPPVKILTRPAKAAVGIAGDAAKGAAGVVRDSGGAVLRGAGKLLKGVGGAVRGVTGGERAPEEDR
jgi:hypothetical protein